MLPQNCHTVHDELNNLAVLTSSTVLLACRTNMTNCSILTVYNFVSHRWCTSRPHTLTLCCSSCFAEASLCLVHLMESSSISHQTLKNWSSLRYALYYLCSLTLQAQCRSISFVQDHQNKCGLWDVFWLFGEKFYRLFTGYSNVIVKASLYLHLSEKQTVYNTNTHN